MRTGERYIFNFNNAWLDAKHGTSRTMAPSSVLQVGPSASPSNQCPMCCKPVGQPALHGEGPPLRKCRDPCTQGPALTVLSAVLQGSGQGSGLGAHCPMSEPGVQGHLH